MSTKRIPDEELIGSTYGQLTIISVGGVVGIGASAKRLVKCKCECGTIKEYKLGSLRNGNTTTCGCRAKPYKTFVIKKYGVYHIDLLYIYWSIKSRCLTPTSVNYHNYGGRGIGLCLEWADDFIKFYCWCIDNGWQKGLEIDRINNNGNYEHANIRFVTKAVNARNKRQTRLINYDNQELCLKDWAIKLNVNYDALRYRLNKGWSVEAAFTKKLSPYRQWS